MTGEYTPSIQTIQDAAMLEASRDPVISGMRQDAFKTERINGFADGYVLGYVRAMQTAVKIASLATQKT